ncbi:hypothetical protein CGL51_13020 [Pyrobaculum aerophilum]|uniref:Uncharacterized protein n=1 Tax=Pyrobaculum aerophilum TaxID=13773 RepID=A0A371QUI8_9CREN|nr:hypothetical protein CGL51_13020 [Pyrobaculum aerophilum]
MKTDFLKEVSEDAERLMGRDPSIAELTVLVIILLLNINTMSRIPLLSSLKSQAIKWHGLVLPF